MSRLNLFWLGPPRIELEGAPVEIKRRKGLALLSYLAVTNERQSRETLATLFWPESSHSRARKALRRDLSELNLALGGAWLEVGQVSIGLRAGFWLDVAQFQADVAHAAADPQTLMAAAALYRDDFLTGFTLPDCPEFDEWQFFQTESLRQALASALERLVGLLSGQADYEGAIPYARRWLALDPLHEAAHRQLMQLYAQAGQKAAALRQYEVCRQTLADEFGVSPSPETTALYDDIRTGKLTTTAAISPVPLPSRSPAPRRHNLPTQTTTFIGRERELADIQGLLLDEPDCRLLNLVGPGGIGKTRLGLAAAAQTLDAFPDGAYFVLLAPIGEVEFIVPAIAEALRFTFYGSTDPKDQLLDYLSQKQLLLLVDNVEHLLEGVDLLSDILSHAPAVTLLATSRERLHLQEEWIYEVQGLHFPTVKGQTSQVSETAEVLTSYSAVELFLQRARQTEANFAPSATELADIGRICQLVEGMPLGLELAAAWIRTLSCREIATEIECSLDFLTTPLRNVPERHRSLRAVFEQTWGRLSQPERAVLMQLSVFRGGCTREAAEQVTGATLPVLSSLVDKALLRRTNTGRYGLHELIRQFAEAQLQADPTATEQAQQRHRDYFVAFLEARTAGVKGPRQKETIGEIKADLDNVRLAWRRAVANRDAQTIERAAECLFVYYLYSSGHYEGQAAFQQAVAALATIPDAPADDIQPHQLNILDHQENLVGFLLAVQAYFLARTSGRQVLSEDVIRQLLLAKPTDKRKSGIALAFLSWAIIYQGRLAASIPYAELALTFSSETGEMVGEAWSLIGLGSPGVHGRPGEAEGFIERALIVSDKSGDPSIRGYSCQSMGWVSVELGKYAQARQNIEQTIAIFEALGQLQGLGYGYFRAGQLAIALGDYTGAIQHFRQALAFFDETRSGLHANYCRVWLGMAFRLQGDYHQAEQTSQETLAIYKAMNDPTHIGYSLLNLGCLAQDQGDLAQAEQLLREALDVWQQTGQEARIADVSRYLGHLMVASGEHRHSEARQYFQQALELSTKHQMVPIVLDVCAGVAQLLIRADELEQAIELATLAEQHEASTFETKEKARQHLAELMDQLPPEAAQAAQARGRRLAWQSAAKRLIDELLVAEQSASVSYGRHHLPRHNLPTQTTTFIGRERELADIQRLLLDEPDCRLLNLIGPGGIGKTRLALAAATRTLDAFPDGAYFVSLAPVGEIEYIVPAIAEALRFTFYGSTDPKDQLLDYLSRKQLLLLVDNVEHLFEGADLLSEILGHAPHVTLLVTSRERLHLQEEWVYEVRGLHFPTVKGETSQVSETAEVLTSYSAVELFTQRARQIAAGFVPSTAEMADIGCICQLVEGMPLGIELAAPWIKVLSCQEIAVEIKRSLDFLTTPLRNVPERHRSLRAVFEQTWGRLSQAERAVLMQLSVFRGGCTREAAEQVTGATLPVLSSLVDRALLRRTNLGRYELHELIRQFAETQLQTNPAAVEQTQQRHQDYFIAFLEVRAAGVKGGRQKETLAEIRGDMDNVRLAWQRAVANRDAQAIERAAECLFVFYLYSSGRYEGQTAFQQAAAAFIEGSGTVLDDGLPDELIVLDRQENLVGFLLAAQAYFLAHTPGHQVLPEQVIARLLRAKPGNKRKEAIALAFLSWAINYQGRITDSRPYAELALTLSLETGDLLGEWWSLIAFGSTDVHSQPAKAEQFLKRALAVCQKSGDPSARGYSCQNLGWVSVELGKYGEARQFFDQAIMIFEELGNTLGLGVTLFRAGQLATALGDYVGAIRIFRQALAYCDEARSALHASFCRIDLGIAFRLQGDYRQAEQLSRETLTVFKAMNSPRHAGYCLLNLGCLAQAQGDLPQAEQLQREALEIWQQSEHEARVADASRCLGKLMVVSGEPRYAEARQYFRQALELAMKHQMAPVALDVFVGVAQLLAQAGEMEHAVELLTLAEQHEASTFETREKARQHLAELMDQLPPEAAQAAVARGKMLDWQLTATRLIAELK